MNLNLDKEVEDMRGKILFFSYGDKRFNVDEIKKGFARGGHYHQQPQLHIILFGEIEYHGLDLSRDKEEIKILSSSESVLVPSNTPHLFIALKDSLFVEVYENQYEATDYPRFRRIVEEKMKSSNPDIQY